MCSKACSPNIQIGLFKVQFFRPDIVSFFHSFFLSVLCSGSLPIILSTPTFSEFPPYLHRLPHLQPIFSHTVCIFSTLVSRLSNVFKALILLLYANLNLEWILRLNKYFFIPFLTLLTKMSSLLNHSMQNYKDPSFSFIIELKLSSKINCLQDIVK